jgi:ubiquinone/menaquinone biosynthesis C-methylase UbiE
MADDVASAYDVWADSYDTMANATRDLDAVMLRELLNARGRDVVEVGCGTGKNTVWPAEHARSVVALDFSAGMLAKARERVTAANVRFVQQDVCELHPFRQLQGGQAQFAVQAAVAAGLRVERLHEIRDEAGGVPRLLAMTALRS